MTRSLVRVQQGPPRTAGLVLAIFVLSCSSSSTNSPNHNGGTGGDAQAIGGAGGVLAPDAGACAPRTFDCDHDSDSICECTRPANSNSDCTNGCGFSCKTGFASDEIGTEKVCAN